MADHDLGYSVPIRGVSLTKSPLNSGSGRGTDQGGDVVRLLLQGAIGETE